MNKTAIKNFAIWARNKLIADIQYRAGLLGITSTGIKQPLSQSNRDTQFFDIGTAEPYSISGEEIRQRDSLVKAINQKAEETDYATAYKYIIEGVAYTWFNRLIAVRFMEVNDYLPSHIRVLSSESGKMEPDLVTTPFDAELPFTESEQQEIIRLKNDNELDICFRILFIKQCNALNEILPALFEKTSDYTEILLNISVIDKEGVVYHLVNDIPEDDFNIDKGGQVEIIGWLYQYYNTEPKNEAFAKSGKITKEEIPAVTQLFTPDWIVRYMVENSLGRLWVEGHPNDSLKSGWKYYLEEAEQESEVQVKLDEIHAEYAKLRPEDIHFIDPCMGSGHILVYAFEVLMQIYESAGYSQRDAARSILENNLYGLDIDDRAYQMAYFAVMMKARQYNRRILSAETPCHVYSIQDSNSINRNQLQYFGADLSELEKNNAINQITGLLDTFVDAKEYGSILDVQNYEWDLLRRFVANTNVEGQMSFDTIGIDETQGKLVELINIGETMARKYEVVVTNPPYMGISNGSPKLNEYVKRNYKNTKSDLFAIFIERGNAMVCAKGINCMVTMQAWMFLPSFETMRCKIIKEMTITNLMQMDNMVMGIAFGTAVSVLRKHYVKGYKGLYNYVSIKDIENNIPVEFPVMNERYSITSCDTFESISGSPIAYWISKNVSKAFNDEKMGKYTTSKCGMGTSDNNKFLRLWHEVLLSRIGFEYEIVEDTSDCRYRWMPYDKGGDYRKWYGNQNYVVNFYNNGLDIKEATKNATGGRVVSTEYYFRKHFSWSDVTNGILAFRFFDKGFIFDACANSVFADDHTLKYALGFSNTKIVNEWSEILNPTIHFKIGNFQQLPYPSGDESKVIEIVSDNIELCRTDWNYFESSWNFKKNPLVWNNKNNSYISDNYTAWEEGCNNRFNQLKANEEELNRIFIDIYGLQDELTPEVEDKDVTVRKADLQRDIKSLLSYAVGCMFGRYSLDVEGLAYAGGEWDAGKYSTFIPDDDNVIPITDEEYFEDDIVGLLCAWLKKVYGENTLEQNLDFIAQALGKKGNTSRDIIRNYFLTDFFKDHCQTYSVTGSGKRPIYWLFDSGKQNGFKALIYLHRYNADTIGNLRVDYLHRMQRVYESEIGRMQDMIDHSTNSREVGAATKRKEKLQKQLKECKDYDEKIAHLALARTELDLDDGVKYNYRKVQLGTDGKFYEVLADSKAIMMDEKKFRDFKK
ncbi:MAG: BREX-1 system adenine-specific DNA-methyltransferase PglX [Lachnospiraceae bacterium]|nr:BREX-1 system adenine-specific DNA-methyltransferase PglX [Lachnospiraceae bacterium]